uniref:Uncharacterized protein n=1 Tax=Rhizophora mucronata TaxID=61149 RepID=A0A2P2NDF1_RHIMU
MAANSYLLVPDKFTPPIADDESVDEKKKFDIFPIVRARKAISAEDSNMPIFLFNLNFLR